MKYIEKLIKVTHNLEKCNRVIRFNTKEENQADTLANSLIDIEESFKSINKIIPKLYLNDLTEDKVDNLILEIGEELRHVLYHIYDTKVFDYLKFEDD